jgi:hypothetical protein
VTRRNERREERPKRKGLRLWSNATQESGQVVGFNIQLRY